MFRIVFRTSCDSTNIAAIIVVAIVSVNIRDGQRFESESWRELSEVGRLERGAFQGLCCKQRKMWGEGLQDHSTQVGAIRD